jgi:hypothetical protein
MFIRSMSADPKVHRAAALLVERDGLSALDVAKLRAKSCASRRDREGAMVWTIIAEEITAMNSEGAKAVMKAGPVTRHEMDSTTRRFRHKLGRE